MNNPRTLLDIITSHDPLVRDIPLEAWSHGLSATELLAGCAILDPFRRQSENLYHRVRATFFLYAIHRFLLPPKLAQAGRGLVPFDAYSHLLSRRFEEAIDILLARQVADGPSDAICSA